MYSDYLIVMKEGQIINYGTVKEVFGINAYVGINPINNKLQVSFMHTHEHIAGIVNDHMYEDGFTGVHTHK